jgi:hypothetical protein
MFDVELVAAVVSGDLAHPGGFEHPKHSTDGRSVQAAALRVTHVYRRDHGASSTAR